MGIQTGKKDSRNKQLKTFQDHPLPIGSDSFDDDRLDRLIFEIQSVVSNVKDFSQKKAFDDLLDIISILREKKPQFNPIRDNIEILWRRLAKVSDDLNSFSKEDPTTSSTTVEGNTITNNIISSAQDLYFFAYDLVGLVVIGASPTVLTFDTQSNVDSPYSHTLSTGIVEILQSEDYDVEINGSFYGNEGDVVQIKLQVDTGSGYVDVPGSHSFSSM